MPGFPPRWRPAERGSALLLAVMLVLILGIVGLAVANRASRDTESVSAKRHHDQSVTCADAARELLMSQFSAYGTTPTQLTLNSVAGDHTLASGHYDNFGVTVTSVVAAAGAAQPAMGVTENSNKIIRASLGGQVYRMTVVCSAPPAAGSSVPRQSEVEYLVRFGL